MIVVAPAPTQQRRDGKQFFYKNHVHLCSSFYALFTGAGSTRKKSRAQKIGARRARGAIEFCCVIIQCVRGRRLWVRGGVGFVSEVCLSVAALVLRWVRHLLFGMGLVAIGSFC